MKFDENSSFLFEAGNKNGLIDNEATEMFTKDFTALVRFKPDWRKMKTLYAENSNRYTGCLFGKNGQHIGAFYTLHTDEHNNDYHTIAFEYWEKTQDLAGADMKFISVDITSTRGDEFVDLIYKRDNDVFSIKVGDIEKQMPVSRLIDYSESYFWLAAANRLSADHNSIFHGDITLMHIQESVLTDEECEEFFNNTTDFIKYVSKRPESRTVFTSTFRHFTDYKILDESDNGNHPIKFSKEWLS